MRGDATNRRGFTLIEMLITVSMFGLVLSTLLVGLYVGSGAMTRVERTLSQSQESRRLVRQLTYDFRSATLALDGEILRFQAAPSGETLVSFYRLASGRRSESNWQTHLVYIQYTLEETEENGLALVRTEAPVILDEPLDVDNTVTLASGLAEVQFSYHSGGDWVEEWDDTAALPAAVLIEAQWLSGVGPRHFRYVVDIPAHAFYSQN